MAAFATVPQLTARLGRELPPDVATDLLDEATAAIRADCGWTISQETVTAAVLDGTGVHSIWLPTLRLTAVASVVEDGATLVYDTDYTWTSLGRLVRAGRWSSKPRSVVVTYTHGWSPVPAVVRGICLALSARAFDNPSGLRSETVGAVSWTAAGSALDVGPGLSESERRSLAAFRLLALA